MVASSLEYRNCLLKWVTTRLSLRKIMISDGSVSLETPLKATRFTQVMSLALLTDVRSNSLLAFCTPDTADRLWGTQVCKASPVGWICGYRTTDTEELWIHRANFKFPVSFWLCWGSVSPTPALFKDQLYTNLRDLFLSWQNLVIDWDRWGVRSLMRCVFLIDRRPSENSTALRLSNAATHG